MKFSIIVCHDNGLGIGFEGNLPWDIREEKRFFQKCTEGNILSPSCLIVGFQTFQEMKKIHGETRHLFVVSSQNFEHEYIFKSLQHALNVAEISKYEKVFVCGGVQLYKEALNHVLLESIYLTKIKHKFPCDRFLHSDFNNLLDHFEVKSRQEKHYGEHLLLTRKNIEEWTYLQLMNNIFKYGYVGESRNSITTSLFGDQISFDLKKGFPLLTTKKMPIKMIFEELMFFLRGETNTKILEDKNIFIWKGNTNRQFLDDHGFNDYEEGEMGPMYGYQWRNFNSQGKDQLLETIELLKTDPNSRRIIMTTFNPLDADKGVLYPCHGIAIQFYIDKHGLSCHMYQRAADWLLGVPFNIASYALLTHLIGKTIGLSPSTLTISFGNYHIYKDHVDACKKQLERIPFEFPNLTVENCRDIADYKFSDLKLTNYNSYSSIKAPMIA